MRSLRFLFGPRRCARIIAPWLYLKKTLDMRNLKRDAEEIRVRP